MAYTLSLDVSLKIKKSQVKGISNHNFRDVLDHGFEHSNEAIDPDQTKNNQTFFYDQEKQSFEPCTDISQIQDSLANRLSKVKKPLRKDAVVARGIILQLDPEWYEDNGLDPENTTHADMLEWACNTFGEQNIVGLSVHEDETNPHMHLLFCPVTLDGRLSQKDWFSDPASLRNMHDDFRQHMLDKGYDISLDRQPKRKHMSVDEYKTFKEAEDKVSELREWEKDLKQRSNALHRAQNAVAEQQNALQQQQQQLNRMEQRIKQQTSNEAVFAFGQQQSKLHPEEFENFLDAYYGVINSQPDRNVQCSL